MSSVFAKVESLRKNKTTTNVAKITTPFILVRIRTVFGCLYSFPMDVTLKAFSPERPLYTKTKGCFRNLSEIVDDVAGVTAVGIPTEI